MPAAFELEASPPADWPPCALGPASVQMTAGFQARLGCDACTRRFKEIDATLAMGMRHPPTLSSQREARPRERAAESKPPCKKLNGAKYSCFVWKVVRPHQRNRVFSVFLNANGSRG